jgi:hypothetical protein
MGYSRLLRHPRHFEILLVGLFLLIAGCSQAATETGAQVVRNTIQPPATQEQPTAIPQPNISIPNNIPHVDTLMHIVPLEEVYFDTFQPQNRAVPLSRASDDLILSLRDAIPPIHNPVYESAAEAAWLNDGDMVLGYSAGDQAWAYPVKILNFHEIVNDYLAGEPFLISYCPLCYSGIIFSRILDGEELVFGNTSALYESDMVMLDYETGSYWWQVAGQAIVGELAGDKLQVLPSRMAAWAEWRETHPDTMVLSRETGYDRNYDQDPFLGFDQSVNQGRFIFPVSPDALDDRLNPGDKVLTIQSGEGARAYLLDPELPKIYQDQVDGRQIVVFSSPEGPAGSVYFADLDGTEHSFILNRGQFTDEETGSIWDLSGRAIDGQLEGTQLEAVPSKVSFWFAIVAAEPGIELGGK